MGNVFTLDSLREEIEREYAPLTFEADGRTFVLRNLLRVSKSERTELVETIKLLQRDQDDISEDEAVSALNNVFRVVTADEKGSELVGILGDDLPTLMKLMEHWQEATQPGEASDSPSS